MIGLSGKTIPPPPRGDSLPGDGSYAQMPALPPMLDDNLHDLRRNLNYGEEHDLKDALKRAIGLVEQLRSLLKDAHKAHSELEISLKLSRSNLQLALENNNMLEDALRRESGAMGARDVGWRRSRTGTAAERPSSRQGTHRSSLQESITEDDQRRPASRRGSTASTTSALGQSTVASAPTSPVARPAASPVIPAPPSSSGHDNRRFFGFRFGGSGNVSPNPNVNGNGGGTQSRPQTPPLRKPTDSVRDAAHLTSASLPSLVQAQAAEVVRRDEELTAALEAERAKCAKALTEKAELEKELESLSQALFEEANKMVAQERIKRAEAEEELQTQLAEKQAIQSAMRIVEQENKRLRAPSETFLSSQSSVNESQYGSTPHVEENAGNRSRASSRASVLHESSRRRVSSPEPLAKDARPRAQSAVRTPQMGITDDVRRTRASSGTGASLRSQSVGRHTGDDQIRDAYGHTHTRAADSVSSTRALRTRSRSGSRSSLASGSIVSSSVLSAMPVEDSPWAH